MRILAADDDPDILQVLRLLLSSWGHEVATASDGIEALRLLGGPGAPPLAILDSVMPGLSGPEVCRRVRETRGKKPLHLILLTSVSGESDVEKGLDSGADDYILKPFSPRDLRARLTAAERVLRLEEDLSRRIGELEETLARVQKLEGLIPICMYCRKIRDDRSYWHQVEAYFKERSKARFTYGICPECEAKEGPG